MNNIEIGDKVILAKTDETKDHFGYLEDEMFLVGSICLVEDFIFDDEGVCLEGCGHVYHVEDFVKVNK